MYNLNNLVYGISRDIDDLIGTALVLWLVFHVVQIVALWRIFRKMGHPGWYSVIPLLKSYILYNELYADGWLFWLASIPLLQTYFVYKCHTDLAHNFGRSTLFGVGMSVPALSAIFYLILGFSNSEYIATTYSFWNGRDVTPVAERPKPAKQQERFISGIHPSSNSRNTIPPFQEERCCICNRALGQHYSILFTNDYGAEARIDDNCSRALYTLENSENEQSIQHAIDFLRGRLKSVDPKVAAYLNKYIKLGEDYLFR